MLAYGQKKNIALYRSLLSLEPKLYSLEKPLKIDNSCRLYQYNALFYLSFDL